MATIWTTQILTRYVVQLYCVLSNYCVGPIIGQNKVTHSYKVIKLKSMGAQSASTFCKQLYVGQTCHSWPKQRYGHSKLRRKSQNCSQRHPAGCKVVPNLHIPRLAQWLLPAADQPIVMIIHGYRQSHKLAVAGQLLIVKVGAKMQLATMRCVSDGQNISGLDKKYSKNPNVLANWMPRNFCPPSSLCYIFPCYVLKITLQILILVIYRVLDV